MFKRKNGKKETKQTKKSLSLYLPLFLKLNAKDLEYRNANVFFSDAFIKLVVSVALI